MAMGVYLWGKSGYMGGGVQIFHYTKTIFLVAIYAGGGGGAVGWGGRGGEEDATL